MIKTITFNPSKEKKEKKEKKSKKDDNVKFITLKSKPKPKSKSKPKKLTPNEIAEDLTGFTMVKNKKEIAKLAKFTRIKYLKKATGEYKKGGMLLIYNPKENYIVLQGFGTNKLGQPIKFSLNLDDVILFKEKK